MSRQPVVRFNPIELTSAAEAVQAMLDSPLPPEHPLREPAAGTPATVTYGHIAERFLARRPGSIADERPFGPAGVSPDRMLVDAIRSPHTGGVSIIATHMDTNTVSKAYPEFGGTVLERTSDRLIWASPMLGSLSVKSILDTLPDDLAQRLTGLVDMTRIIDYGGVPYGQTHGRALIQPIGALRNARGAMPIFPLAAFRLAEA